MEWYWRNGRQSVLVQICALFRLHCLYLCIFFIIKHIFFSGRHFLPPDRLWSSLIISDQPWPTCDLQPHISGSSSTWSPGSLLLSGHFFKIYEPSEVGLLLFFVEVQFYPLVFISAVQIFGFLLAQPGTTSIRCEIVHPCISILWSGHWSFAGAHVGLYPLNGRDDLNFYFWFVLFFCYSSVPGDNSFSLLRYSNCENICLSSHHGQIWN